MNNPKVTIITGYFNRQDYVNDSLHSLLNQTYQNIEIIVFDDASTDNTLANLKYFENIHKRIKVITNKENKGFVRNLIDIISNVDSKYVAIHGSGDISLPERIESQIKFLLSNPEVGIVSCNTTTTNDIYCNYKNVLYYDTDYLRKKNPIAHGGAMFRLKDYYKAGGYRSFFTFSQDRDLWLRMSLYTKIAVLPEVLYKFTKIETSDTVSRNLKKIIIQIMLSSFSSEQILLRKKNG